MSLVAYALVGATGAVILATTLPPILDTYAGAGAAQQAALQATFYSLTHAVYDGLWNILEQFVGGVGWAIFGIALYGKKYTKLGIFTLVLAVFCLLDAFGSIAQLEAVASAGQSAYLVLAPVWAGWLGIVLLCSTSTK